MIREFTASANTVDEAIALACEELGIPVDECAPEIIQLPKKSIFGKIKQQAKVRVQVETPDPPVRVIAPKKEVKPVVKETHPPVVQEAPKKVEIPQRKPEPRVESKPEIPVVKEIVPMVEMEPMDLGPKIALAKEYLLEIFQKMGVENVSAEFTESESRTVIVHLSGKDIGTVIGKRGETLDAIQYLVCLVANRLEGDYVRFTMNAGNYREKREETLRALAQRIARKVLKTGRPSALEPMNPYERRIIHAVITDIEGVFSKSTGEEPNRKVVIKPSFKQGSGSGNFRKSEGRPPQGDRNDRSRRPSPRPAPGTEPAETAERAPEAPVAAEAPKPIPTPVVETPVEAVVEKKPEKKLDDTIKLYSKIEID